MVLQVYMCSTEQAGGLADLAGEQVGRQASMLHVTCLGNPQSRFAAACRLMPLTLDTLTSQAVTITHPSTTSSTHHSPFKVPIPRQLRSLISCTPTLQAPPSLDGVGHRSSEQQ